MSTYARIISIDSADKAFLIAILAGNSDSEKSILEQLHGEDLALSDTDYLFLESRLNNELHHEQGMVLRDKMRGSSCLITSTSYYQFLE